MQITVISKIQDLEIEYSQALTINGFEKCFSTLEDELDWKLGLRKIGSLLPIETDSQWQILADRKEKLAKIGIQSELITSAILRDVEPLIDANVLLRGLISCR